MTTGTVADCSSTSVPKVDGRAIVTGTRKYASDVNRPDMLFGKVLRPPAFKAKLAEEGDFIEIRGSFSSAVPEPSTIVLLGSALLGLVVLARRRSRVAALDAEDRPW